MKKVILGTLLSISVTLSSGCSDKEELKQDKEIKTTAHETNANKEKKDVKKSEAENVVTPRLEIIETIDVFGGGTFDLNKDINGAGDIYITEKEDKVYMTINNGHDGDYRAISGNSEKWQSIGDASFDDQRHQYPRGFYFFKEEDDEIISNMFDYEDMNYTFGPSETIPSGDSLRLVNTSKGEGFIVGNDNSYKLYVNSELILEFIDVKEIMDMVPFQTQFVTEAGIYIDIELKKMYFLEEYGDSNNIFQLDLESGEPLFDNGDMKKIVLAGPNVDIIGDANGNIFVVQSGEEKVTVAIYNKDLDPLTDEMDVPVKNPVDVAVTLTTDELHIWNVYSYELEPALQLVKLTKESVSSINVSTEDSADNEGTGTDSKNIVMNFLEASSKNDDEIVDSFIVTEFGEDYKEVAIGGFRDIPEFEILDVSIAEEPDRTYLPKDIAESPDIVSYNALINLKEGPQAGRGTLIVTLYKEKDGWKVVTLNSK